MSLLQNCSLLYGNGQNTTSAVSAQASQSLFYSSKYIQLTKYLSVYNKLNFSQWIVFGYPLASSSQ